MHWRAVLQRVARKAVLRASFPRSGESAFLPVFLRKLQRGDFTFQGVWFPEPVTFFSEFTADAEFGGATFKQEVKFLEGAAFRGKANFFGATFDEKAMFLSTFNEPSFFYRCYLQCGSILPNNVQCGDVFH